MTSTELLDKNGKEIKLNHIVKIYGKFKHIFFFEGCFGYMTENSIIRNDLELDKYGTDAFVSISREKAKNMEVIGTWTGLKDKNGNLILVNDIIKINGILKVYYKEWETERNEDYLIETEKERSEEIGNSNFTITTEYISDFYLSEMLNNQKIYLKEYRPNFRTQEYHLDFKYFTGVDIEIAKSNCGFLIAEDNN